MPELMEIFLKHNLLLNMEIDSEWNTLPMAICGTLTVTVQFHLNWIVITDIFSLSMYVFKINTSIPHSTMTCFTDQVLRERIFHIKSEHIHRVWDNTVLNTSSSNDSTTKMNGKFKG